MDIKKLDLKENFAPPADRQLIDQTYLLSIARDLLNSPNINSSYLLEQIRNLIPFEQAVLFRFFEGNLNLLAKYGDGLQQNSLIRLPVMVSPELFNAIWFCHPSIRFDHQDGSGDFPPDILPIQKAGFFDMLFPSQTQIWAPLTKDNCLLGWLGFGQNGPDGFSEYHLDLLRKIGELVGAALANADSYFQVQKTAAREERKSLARNLHDAVNQSLFSAGLIAEVLPHVWNKDQVEGKKSLEDLRRLIRGAQAEIRIILVDLRNSPTIDVEIADLLHLLANAFTGRTNIPVVEEIEKDNSLPPKIQTAYYHLCQEALNNIFKHAKATSVQVSFRKQNDVFILSIKDNGIGFERRRKGNRRDRKDFGPENRDTTGGFNPKYLPPGHYGLRMMSELATSVGADMKVETRPGFGTSISIFWKNNPQKEDNQE